MGAVCGASALYVTPRWLAAELNAGFALSSTAATSPRGNAPPARSTCVSHWALTGSLVSSSIRRCALPPTHCLSFLTGRREEQYSRHLTRTPARKPPRVRAHRG